jgi:hypothetical protein
MKQGTKLLMVAQALAAGVPLHLLGHFRGMRALPTKKVPKTQSDFDAIAKAQAKRDRKAQRNRELAARAEAKQ